MEPVATSFGPPRLPSSFTRTFGTMKSDRPFVPAGAPSMRASTRWMMFSARSWSPAEIQHLVPLMAYRLPSMCFARVFVAPTSDPACGSERHMVPAKRPASMCGRKRALSSGSAKCWITSAAPCVRPGYMLNAVLAPLCSSCRMTSMACGPPNPPASGGMANDTRPRSKSLFQASLKPAGVCTVPPSSRQPVRSPDAFSGPVTSVTKRAHWSMTASHSTRERCA